ncbi:MAG: hypothetical protein E3J47_04045 [Candidatus Stahlbacteria bacterium]|nr:MAG: hypothetical protein E3J47_04045 [Candidatus Stahlbacteria bacterium]
MKRIIAISICLVFVLSASTILLAPEKMEKRLTLEEFEKKVLTRIENRNAKLESLFVKHEYDMMAAEFTRYATIKTHEKDVVNGQDSAEYWRSLGEELKATDLRFKLKSFYGWKLMLNDPPCPEETDFVIFEITKFSFKGGSEGEEGSGYRHRVKCIED